MSHCAQDTQPHVACFVRERSPSHGPNVTNGSHLTVSYVVQGVTPMRPGTVARFTEADVKQRVDDALKRSAEEAAIVQVESVAVPCLCSRHMPTGAYPHICVQMETEDLRRRLTTEQDNARQMASVVEEYSQAMARMIEERDTAKGSTTDAVQRLDREKAQVCVLARFTSTDRDSTREVTPPGPR